MPSGTRPSSAFHDVLMLPELQELQVGVAMLLEPALMGLGRQRPDEPQAPLSVGEDAHHPSTTLYISASAETRAFSERWYRLKRSVDKRPSRSRGTRNSSFPTRVARVRGVARPIAETGLGALTWTCSERLGHLRLEDLLHHLAHDGAHESASSLTGAFQSVPVAVSFFWVMVCSPLGVIRQSHAYHRPSACLECLCTQVQHTAVRHVVWHRRTARRL